MPVLMPSFLDHLPDGLTATPCRGACDEPFSHDLRGRQARKLDEEAKRICALCPVRPACLDYALKAREPYGVWGGLTADERTALLRQATEPPTA
ncbi:Transcriptional regulator WhiD [Streptomyces sp. 111WW2]|uniref:WhiB family transcriptional regulator n=1 Tax=Streptomyces sp. 111WW2 TaxID=1945515 RepID=UPI000D298355|nr:WhiB family transcriptional regulator [Streptomyces sp. 111WW2]PSK52427.1 Transcriptional regulator WhiD [Streptomyces sp. 111WW2]